MKSKYANLVLLLLSIGLSLVIAEGVMRFVYDPVDYLRPQLREDHILKLIVVPHSGGHDAWGFRNKRIPEATHILAIGDSQTYGDNATHDQTWPAQLQRLLNKPVYNMGMGGHDPTQYYYLLKERGLQLRPSLVIVGFYYGNDLMEAYTMVYEKKGYWQYLRDPGFAAKHPLTAGEKPPMETLSFERMLHILHEQFGERSVLYRKVFDACEKITYRIEAHLKGFGPEDRLPLGNGKGEIYTVLTPRIRFNVLNINQPEVREGLRISLDLFSRMKAICDAHNIKLLVLLIPTKESVYGEHVKSHIQLSQHKLLNGLLANERQVNDLVKSTFKRLEIEHIDLLPVLRNGTEQSIYGTNLNGHPTKNGYKMIGEAIKKWYQDRHFE